MLQSANDPFFCCCSMALFCQSMLVAVFHDQLRLKSMPLLMSLGCSQISMDSFTFQTIQPLILARTLLSVCLSFHQQKGTPHYHPSIVLMKRKSNGICGIWLKENQCIHVYICMLAPTMMHNKNVLFFPHLSDEPKSSVILKPLVVKFKTSGRYRI